MNHYELLYLVPATYSEDELMPIKQKVKDLIERQEGKITLEDSLGKRKLAYPIKQVRHGYYLLYELDLSGENLKKLNRELELTPEILRHQTVKKKLQAPSMVEITQQKIEREKAEAKERKKPAKEVKEKVKLEDLDKKLDELLEGDIM